MDSLLEECLLSAYESLSYEQKESLLSKIINSCSSLNDYRNICNAKDLCKKRKRELEIEYEKAKVEVFYNVIGREEFEACEFNGYVLKSVFYHGGTVYIQFEGAEEEKSFFGPVRMLVHVRKDKDGIYEILGPTSTLIMPTCVDYVVNRFKTMGQQKVDEFFNGILKLAILRNLGSPI